MQKHANDIFSRTIYQHFKIVQFAVETKLNAFQTDELKKNKMYF